MLLPVQLLLGAWSARGHIGILCLLMGSVLVFLAVDLPIAWSIGFQGATLFLILTFGLSLMQQ